MERRNFLSTLGISSLAIGATALKVGGAQDSGARFKGYAIGWTGWKLEAGSSRIAGQWLAAPDDLDMPMLFASVPGWHGTYHEGDCFNLTVFAEKGQIYISETTPGDVKESQRQLGFEVIKKLIGETAG